MNNNLNNHFYLLPAIDISDSKAVRLKQGELSEQTNYGNPVDVAKQFADVFERHASENRTVSHEFWVHLVDLDLAFGRGDNRLEIQKVCELLIEEGVNVELSGGIRDDSALVNALSLGVARVNIGTAAIENPKWMAQVALKYADKVAVGLDVRGETLASRGWTKEGGNLWDEAKRLENDGIKRFVVTDVERDGMLRGANLELMNEVAQKTSVNVTVSGGISSLKDIENTKKAAISTNFQIDSVIFGKALYSGNFTLTQALNML